MCVHTCPSLCVLISFFFLCLMNIFSRRGLHPQPYQIPSLQVLFWRIPLKRNRFIRRKHFLFWVFDYTLSLDHFPWSFHPPSPFSSWPRSSFYLRSSTLCPWRVRAGTALKALGRECSPEPGGSLDISCCFDFG